jgi:hypothetical protein
MPFLRRFYYLKIFVLSDRMKRMMGTDDDR